MIIIQPCRCGLFECNEVIKTKTTKATIARDIAELRLTGKTEIRIKGVGGRKLLRVTEAFKILEITS